VGKKHGGPASVGLRISEKQLWEEETGASSKKTRELICNKHYTKAYFVAVSILVLILRPTPLLLRYWLLLFTCLLGKSAFGQARIISTNFWQQQLTYARVQAAYARCWPTLATRLQAQHLDPARLEVFFRLIKTTRVLEVWGRNQGQADATFQLLWQYPLAATSGTLGPKRRAGDAQVPEGFYHVNRFNPLSLFHLSLGLDYPNADDVLATGLADPGGDIFIHGSNVTDGCLPLTDAGIDEVYLLAIAARAAGQASLAVHIFPFPLTESELTRRAASPHATFWRGLAPGYAYFEQHHMLGTTQ
jgi:murein L,D-transpeptidase YafK